VVLEVLLGRVGLAVLVVSFLVTVERGVDVVFGLVGCGFGLVDLLVGFGLASLGAVDSGLSNVGFLCCVFTPTPPSSWEAYSA
jgi:hypothetical protein